MDQNLLNYYQYVSEGDYYYFCIEDSTTTFDFPKDAIVFDPTTLACIYAPGMPLPSYAGTAAVEDAASDPACAQETHEQQHSTQESAEPQEIGEKCDEHQSNSSLNSVPEQEVVKPDLSAATSLIPVPVETPIVINDDVKEQMKKQSCASKKEPAKKAAPVAETFDRDELLNKIKKFSSEDFAKKHFHEHKTGWFFNRKVVPPTDLIKYSEESLNAPLLQQIPKNLHKDAIHCFDLILLYTGAKKAKSKVSQNLKALSCLLYQHEELRDEVYFQLVKQTTNNNNQQCLQKTWEVFLVICSIFPSSRNSELTISAHIASTLTQTTDPEIKKFSELAYIRFEARCQIGKAPRELPNVLDIASAPYTSAECFGISITECLWIQRNVQPSSVFPKAKKSLFYPKCQIPYVLHVMTKAILSKGGQKMEGIFRVPGNSKKVDDAAEKINHNVECVNEMNLNDIASLFKKWWADLPTKIIPPSKTEEFVRILSNETPNCDQALSIMTPSDRISFLYLIGFLREMSEGKSVTLMGPSNLALVFAPNLYVMPNNMNLAKQMNSSIQNFIVYLIENCDISQVYPLDLGNL